MFTKEPTTLPSMHPAEMVTTKYLQKARRFAERKKMPPPPPIATQIDVRHDAVCPTESVTESSNPAISLRHAPPYKPPGLPPLGRACCTGYCPVRIGDLLRMLPRYVFESAAHVNKNAFDKATWSSFSVKEQLDARLGNPQTKECALRWPPQENPSTAHLTITFEISTQIKKDIKANRTMENLLVKNADNFRRLEYDLDFLFNDMDCLCLFLCDLLRDQTTPSAPRIHYTRLMPGGQEHGQCILVCWTAHVVLTGNGQVMEVIVPIHFLNCHSLMKIAHHASYTVWKFSPILIRRLLLCRSATPSIPSRPRSTTPPPTTTPSPARCAL